MTYISTDHDLQRFFTMSRDMLCIAGFDGYFQLLSPAWRTTLGYSFAELTAQPFIDFVHADDRASTAAEAAKLAAGGVTATFENRYYAKDGSLRRFAWSATADPDRQLIYASASDITARNSADQALRDSSARIRAILDTAADPIITIDERGIIESFNPAAEQVFEFRAEEVIGRNVSMLMPEPYHSAHDGYMARYLTTGARHIIGIGREVTGRRKSGATFPMELTVSEMHVARQRMFVGVARDITERQRLDRMKSEFVSTVSHELRTPMNAILGFTQLLGYDSNLTDGQQANLAKVRKAGEHLLNLINDVLELSRIEAGKVTVSLEAVALGPVLRECRNLAQPLADARNIKLHVDDGSAAELTVRVDRTRLRQVLINLISNAVKYNRAGGSVWVTCAPGAPGRVRLSVRDDGPGIALDQQAQLFQPFNRLGAERGELEGTGIGLTITKQLVELMRGEIALASAPGAGSTFWVEFAQEIPASAPSPGAPANALPASLCTGAGQHRVLYVEDNPANLELVQALCAQFWPGMQLLSATTAEAGLELAAAQRPDLILMDINLPGMDGYQALACLQADVHLRHIPVIAVTANAMAENIERGRAAGFTGYITKPIDIPGFVSTLERVLLGAPANAPAPPCGARTAAGSTPVLDAHATGQLRDLLGAHAAPIVDSLLNDLPKRLALLRAAIERGDVQAVRYEAHTMKGSSGNLGASGFAALCAQLSDVCKSGELQLLPEGCAALEQEFRERVTPALEQFKCSLLQGR